MLEVWRFGLDHAHVEILGLGHLILVENVVLRGGAVQPRWALALHQNASSGVNIDLFLGCCIKVMVGGPRPDILKIGRGLRSYM